MNLGKQEAFRTLVTVIIGVSVACVLAAMIASLLDERLAIHRDYDEADKARAEIWTKPYTNILIESNTFYRLDGSTWQEEPQRRYDLNSDELIRLSNYAYRVVSQHTNPWASLDRLVFGGEPHRFKFGCSSNEIFIGTEGITNIVISNDWTGTITVPLGYSLRVRTNAP